MLAAVRDVDELLRGRFTRPAELAAGRIAAPAWRLAAAALVLGATYGACMGLFAALRGTRDGALQLSASIAKVPLLFLLTLLVTFPSLYVCSALANSRLQIAATLRLLLTAITVELALLASLGPVTGFFALCTDSYPFMVLLNVALFAITGFVGLTFLKRALGAVFVPHEGEAMPKPAPVPAEPLPGPKSEVELESVSEPPAAALGLKPSPQSPPRASAGFRARRVFVVWLAIYAIIGAQMGWVLRPFVGDPRLPFTLFRERESNFFEACLRAFSEL